MLAVNHNQNYSQSGYIKAYISVSLVKMFKKQGADINALVNTNLIRTRIGDVDNASCLFGLQVCDKTTLERLGLAKDIFLVATTWQREQQTIVILHLQAHWQTLHERGNSFGINLRNQKSTRSVLLNTFTYTVKNNHKELTVILRATLSNCEASSLILWTIRRRGPPSGGGRERWASTVLPATKCNCTAAWSFFRASKPCHTIGYF